MNSIRALVRAVGSSTIEKFVIGSSHELRYDQAAALLACLLARDFFELVEFDSPKDFWLGNARLEQMLHG